EAGLGRAWDGSGLPALLSADAGISAGGVNQRQNRNPEAAPHLHQPLRLAISLRPRHAEIVLKAAFGRRALLMPDDANAFAAKAAEATDDRDVVAEFAVAGQRNEIGDEGADVIEAMGALRMASDLGFLPRREFRVEVFEHVRGPSFEAGKLFADGGCTIIALEGAEFRPLCLRLGHPLV